MSTQEEQSVIRNVTDMSSFSDSHFGAIKTDIFFNNRIRPTSKWNVTQDALCKRSIGLIIQT